MKQTHKFKVGDRVTFTRVTGSGRTIQFKTLTGTIQRLFDTHPGVLVKYHGGRVIKTTLDKIRPEGARTELTEMLSSDTIQKKTK